jgi:SAM-dependent methyltransferase
MTAQPLQPEEFKRLAASDPYWRGRWVYLRHVAWIVSALAPERVLELGPGPHRFVPGSETLDVNERMRPTYLQDAGSAPWPIESGSFDLVLGLQCWEHFGSKQLIAFNEARRVAGHAGHVLISVPYHWRDTNATHRGIGNGKIARWTDSAEPIRRIKVSKPEHRQRVILLYSGI